MKLKNKVEVFRQENNTRKSVFITMIPTFGLTQNQYAKSSIQNEITLDDLFQS